MATKSKATAPVERSYQEKIQEARQVFDSFHATGKGRILPIPPERVLTAGEPLQNIGFLSDCVVAAVFDEGRCVIVDHTRVDHNYGNPITTHHALTGFPWTECFRPVPSGPNKASIREQLGDPVARPDLHTRQLGGIIRAALKGDYVDDPDFQRGYVWTQRDKEAFLEALFAGRPIGSFIFVDYPYEVHQGAQVVLDGKQRLSALTEFMCSQVPVFGKYIHELSPGDRDYIRGVTVQVGVLSATDVSRADLLRVFLEQNTAGVPQSEEHLEHVRKLLRAEQAAAAALENKAST